MPLLSLLLVPLLALVLWFGAGPGPLGAVALALEVPPVSAPVSTPHSFVAEAARAVAPAVVRIDTERDVARQPFDPALLDPFLRDLFGDPSGSMRERGQGSGVVIDAGKGLVLTNAHVVDQVDSVEVTLADGRQVDGAVVGADSVTDLAVVRLEGSGPWPVVGLGNSDALQVGDWVIAVGNPFGLDQTVTLGIVSSLNRNAAKLGITDKRLELIQTDAAINPGNSGGALVNLRGELIGINNMILSRSGGNIGIGFAIPVNMARSVTDQLIKYGSVKRGQLGVTIAPVTPDIAQALGIASNGGALITQVAKESAAARAGLQAGDVVTALNNRKVKSAAELRNAIGLLRVGDKVQIALLREGKARSVTAEIADPAATTTAAASTEPGALPEGTQHRSLEGAQLEDAPDNGGGVLVRNIAPNSRAASAGLRQGDVIVAANGVRVASTAALSAAWRAAAARGGSTLVLQVRRSGDITILVLR